MNLWDLLVNAVSENTWLAYLFDTTLAISLLILLLCAVRPLMKHMPRIVMYLLWMIVAVRLLCPVSIQGIYAFLPERVETEVASTGQKMSASYLAERAARGRLGGEGNEYRLSENTADKLGSEKTLRTELTETEVSDVSRTEAVETLPLSLILTVIWGMGMAVAVFILIFSSVRTRILLSGATEVEKRVYTHPLVDNSFVAGIIRPRIYLSEKITGQDMEYVMAHERVHIKRRDYLIKPLYYLLCSVYWFNPLMWLSFYLMTKDMEVSCDEAVIRNMSPENRKQYSYLLLSLSASRRGNLGQYTAFSIGTIRDRICSVMRYKKPTVAMGFVMVLVLALAGCGAVSSPEAESATETFKNPDSGIYVEQMQKVSDLTENGINYAYTGSRQNYKGQMIQFVADRFEIPYLYVVNGDKGEIMAAPWKENLSEAKKKYKYLQLSDAQIGEDGYLYVTMIQGSSSEEVYRENPEEWYYAGTRMFKIDRESGVVEEIGIPQESMKEVYENRGITIQKGSRAEKEYAGGKAMVPVMCRVCPDGQILVTDRMYVNCLYDPVQKKRTTELSVDLSKADQIQVGDGFFVYLERDEQTKIQSIHVVSLATGKEEYSVELEVEMMVDKEGGFTRNCGVGVSENTILMADATGIYEMDYGEKTFRKVVDTERDNVYYLEQVGKKEYLDILNVLKGESDDYYAGMLDDGARMYCSYTRKK